MSRNAPRAPRTEEGLERLQVNLPPDLLESLTRLASEAELSLSNYARRILRDHVTGLKSNRGKR